MGSTTYEWILDHEFADKDRAEWKWPYDIPCWVFTHRQLPVVPGSGVEFTSADIATVHKQMVATAGDRNVWIVGGGDLAGQFADVGLLDEVIVSIAPVTLGGGAPLLPRRIELRLDDLGRNGDFDCASFSVARPGGEGRQCRVWTAEDWRVQHRPDGREQVGRGRVACEGKVGGCEPHRRAARQAVGDLLRLLPRSRRAFVGDHLESPALRRGR